MSQIHGTNIMNIFHMSASSFRSVTLFQKRPKSGSTNSNKRLVEADDAPLFPCVQRSHSPRMKEYYSSNYISQKTLPVHMDPWESGLFHDSCVLLNTCCVERRSFLFAVPPTLMKSGSPALRCIAVNKWVKFHSDKKKQGPWETCGISLQPSCEKHVYSPWKSHPLFITRRREQWAVVFLIKPHKMEIKGLKPQNQGVYLKSPQLHTDNIDSVWHSEVLSIL